MRQCLSVQGIAADGSPDKKGSQVPEKVPQGPETEISAGGDEGELYIIVVKDIMNQEIVYMTPVAGDHDEGHLLDHFPHPGNPFFINNHTVVYVVPHPGECPVRESDICLVTSRSYFEEILFRLIHYGVIPLLIGDSHFFHELYQSRISQGYLDNLFPRLNNRTDNSPLFRIDPVDDLTSQEIADGFAGFPPVGLQKFGEVHRLGRHDERLVLVPEKGHDPPQCPRIFGLTEEKVRQALVFLLPPAPIGNELRHKKNRGVHFPLCVNKLSQGILAALGAEECRTPEVYHGAQFLLGYSF